MVSKPDKHHRSECCVLEGKEGERGKEIRARDDLSLYAIRNLSTLQRHC